MTLSNYILSFLLLLFTFTLSAQTNFQKRLQTEFIMVENGGTIEIPEGNFKLNASLWLDGKENITIRGEGKNETFLSFKNQSQYLYFQMLLVDLSLFSDRLLQTLKLNGANTLNK